MSTRALQYSANRTLRTVLRDYSTGSERLWYTTGNAFEAYNAAHVAAYGIATGQGTPGTYTWTVPAALPESPAQYEYEAVTYDCAGASLAAGDLTSPAYRSTFEWDGTGVVTIGSALAELPSDSGGPGGAFVVSVHVVDPDNLPVVGARVRMSQNGATRWSGFSNAGGIAAASVDAGYYTRTTTFAGFNGVVEEDVHVAADAESTVQMDRLTFEVSDVGSATGYTVSYDENNQPVGGAIVSIRLYRGGGQAGTNYPRSKVVEMTSAEGTGLTQFPNLPYGAQYQVKRGAGEWELFTVPSSGDSFAIEQFLGGSED